MCILLYECLLVLLYTSSSMRIEICLFGWFLNVLVINKAVSRTGPKTEHLTILCDATHETELGDHDSCLSRSHHTDTDPAN